MRVLLGKVRIDLKDRTPKFRDTLKMIVLQKVTKLLMPYSRAVNRN